MSIARFKEIVCVLFVCALIGGIAMSVNAQDETSSVMQRGKNVEKIKAANDAVDSATPDPFPRLRPERPRPDRPVPPFPWSPQKRILDARRVQSPNRTGEILE